MLGFFSDIFKNCFTSEKVNVKYVDDNTGKIKRDAVEQDVYVPFTNANDATVEVSLVSNTHPDFKAITTRAYYDMQYAKYKKLLRKHGIWSISTFAMVNQEKDKTHNGRFLVKVQRKLAGKNIYECVVVMVDKEGQLVRDKKGRLYINLFVADSNLGICVCEDDFNESRTSVVQGRGVWHPEQVGEDGNPIGIRDIPMVHSTTSSHYSIFRQRIPNYDLKQVRHYLQFKTRLQGMELCLLQLRRNVHLKEVQASECFAKETMALWRLFKEFANNKKLMQLVMEYYYLVAQHDDLCMKKAKLSHMKDGKKALLGKMLRQYAELNVVDGATPPDKNLDSKIALGQKIKSLKLELDKSIYAGIDELDAQLKEICKRAEEIAAKIKDIQDKRGQVDSAFLDGLA